MIPSFLVMFRESFEAVMIAGIVLGFLRRGGLSRHRPKVWLGIGLGVAASVLGAVLFQALAGGFEGTSEQIFEAVTMLAGAALMTSVIVWMTRRGGVRPDLESRDQASGWGFFFLVLVSVLREGIEAVLFLAAARFASADNDLLGAALGLAAAVLLGWLLLRAAVRVNLRAFFLAVNLLLVLFAAGLVAQGVHELTDAGVLPALVQRVWDINPAPRPNGSLPLLHDEGYVGSMARGFFGYRGAPTLIEILAYGAYLAAAIPLWIRGGRRGSPH